MMGFNRAAIPPRGLRPRAGTMEARRVQISRLRHAPEAPHGARSAQPANTEDILATLHGPALPGLLALLPSLQERCPKADPLCPASKFLRVFRVPAVGRFWFCPSHPTEIPHPHSSKPLERTDPCSRMPVALQKSSTAA